MKSNITNIKPIVEVIGNAPEVTKARKPVGKPEFDFLKEANALVKGNRVATQGKGQTLGMTTDQLEAYECAIGELEEKAPVYLPLVAALLESAKPFRDMGTVMLMAFDWDEYCVESMTASGFLDDADEIYELVLSRVGDTPFEWNFDVEQVFYAFRMEAKGNPVGVYALQYTGEKLLYVLLDGQWHKFPGIDEIVEMAIDRSIPGENWMDSKAEDDFIFNHEEMVQACSQSALLTRALKGWEERAKLARGESDRAAELSVQQWEAEHEVHA